ncbi:hypothetical protein Pint_29649 [Pistacia integerrima]|uniref:Uncharacterized protein n=1 Tax=Pistacia integerrima TaxID=434235 RepID=A0ACC0X1T6_9ROSI|nr:hypothetical protein Pint_29649 [Pistacia integerrima]
MQFPEMKSALRCFHSPKLLLPLLKPTHSLSRQFPQISRQIHSVNPRLCSEPDSSHPPETPSPPRVWSIYDPVAAGHVTKMTVTGSGEARELEPVPVPESSVGDDLERERVYGKLRSQSSGDLEKPHVKKNGSLGVGGIIGNKKKGKGNRVSWVCADCGHTDGQWWGTCRSCKSVGTMQMFSEGDSGNRHVVERTWLPQKPEQVQPMRLRDVNKGISQLNWRIPLSGPFGNEVARVLGGGLVPGSLVLVGGDPGVGKSTLLLQMAAIIAEGRDVGECAPVVYVSGEESVEQIGNRADRMEIGAEELFLYCSTDVEVPVFIPIFLMTDLSDLFLCTTTLLFYLKDVTGSAGGLTQVRECTSALLRFAKKSNIPILLAGHVTKSGDIAGPRVLEHIVDAVLYMEGEKCSTYRLLRPVKNRFGSTDELGVFEMSQLVLQVVSNPSQMFLREPHSDSDVLAGLAVAVVMDGTRTFLIEIQALCVSGSTVSRHVNGIQASRADMIIAVLMKQAGLKLQENAIFLNVVSGMALTETSGDLAVAAAICSRHVFSVAGPLLTSSTNSYCLSIYGHFIFPEQMKANLLLLFSFLEFPIPNGIAFIGEIGLSGELHMVPGMEKRASTVAKLGYEKCIVPKSAEKSLASIGLEQIKVIGCENLKEVINIVFTAH